MKSQCCLVVWSLLVPQTLAFTTPRPQISGTTYDALALRNRAQAPRGVHFYNGHDVRAARRSHSRGAVAVRAGRDALEADDEEMSLVDLLKNYGVVALVFHFCVWVSTITTATAVLSLGDLSGLLEALPDALRARLPAVVEGEAGLAIAFPVALGLCEVIGPARLALTVAATPTVATAARKNAAFKAAEAALNKRLTALLIGAGGEN